MAANYSNMCWSSNPGGDIGGIASSKVPENSKIFLFVAWDSLLPAIFWVFADSPAIELRSTDEVFLCGSSKDDFFEWEFADAIAELKVPASLRPWMMDWNCNDMDYKLVEEGIMQCVEHLEE